MDIKEGLQAIHAAAETLRNWGRWGADDQIGTLNHVTPEDVAADGLYEFLFTGPPLNLTGGTGSPINPLAIK